MVSATNHGTPFVELRVTQLFLDLLFEAITLLLKVLEHAVTR